MDKTTVAYNKKNRQWEILGEIGEVLQAFPAGPDGRHAADVAQLQIEAPAALALALAAEKHWPQLNGRAVRAAQLIATDSVLNGDNRWRVRSQSHPRELYTIQRLTTTPFFNCSCHDWRDGAPTIRLADGTWIKGCKHIVAVLILDHLPSPPTWPPSCPSCDGKMEVKRRQDNGSGLPFWSCRNFPFCKGRASFQPHADDVKSADGNGKEALYLSLERARNTGLVAIAASAQRRARQNTLAAAEYRSAVAAGEDPAVAAATVDASAMDYAEHRRHYHKEI